jgi:dinuclear metal center YbgI/SA1388 family protein
MNMITVSDMLDYLWELAPEEGKESWDNVGLLVGRRASEVTKVLVALDITPPVIREAINTGAQLIVSHHPLIWDTYRYVNDSVFQQDKVLRLAENHIAAICMHTNLDEALDGVDDTLVETLGLTAKAHLAEGKIGHICELPEEMDLPEFLAQVKEKLQANGLRYCDSGRKVRRVATGCGSCGEYLMDAVKAGCDTFITGDVKYSVFLDAQGCGINLIDAGHFPTENPITRKLQRKLQARFPEVRVILAENISQPDQFF